MDKKIFISHSHHDATICDEIVNELRIAGITSDIVFCTSIPEIGITENDFPNEILRNLDQSVLNIIVLSRDYVASHACLNEAGIIWFLHNNGKKIPMICLAVKKFNSKKMTGFINQQTCQFFRLSNREKKHSMNVLREQAKKAMGIK